MTYKPSRHNRPNNYRVISRAVELLRSGTPAGELPGRLVDEFGLSQGRARELAGEAIKLYQKQSGRSRLDTRPLDKPG